MLNILLKLSKILFSVAIFLFANNVILANENLPVCYNYGCYIKQNFSISNEEIDYIKNTLFANNTNAEIERQNIIKSIAFLYKIAGKQTPIFRDIAGNYNDPANGKMDCIDHSTNTFEFVHFLEKNNLLKFHQIGKIETRYFLHLIPSHYAISIHEIDSNDSNNNKQQIYIVDSWYANIFQEELPKIFDLNVWKNDDIDLNVY